MLPLDYNRDCLLGRRNGYHSFGVVVICVCVGRGRSVDRGWSPAAFSLADSCPVMAVTGQCSLGREVNAIPFSARGCRDAGFQSVR